MPGILSALLGLSPEKYRNPDFKYNEEEDKLEGLPYKKMGILARAIDPQLYDKLSAVNAEVANADPLEAYSAAKRQKFEEDAAIRRREYGIKDFNEKIFPNLSNEQKELFGNNPDVARVATQDLPATTVATQGTARKYAELGGPAKEAENNFLGIVSEAALRPFKDRYDKARLIFGTRQSNAGLKYNLPEIAAMAEAGEYNYKNKTLPGRIKLALLEASVNKARYERELKYKNDLTEIFGQKIANEIMSGKLAGKEADEALASYDSDKEDRAKARAIRTNTLARDRKLAEDAAKTESVNRARAIREANERGELFNAIHRPVPDRFTFQDGQTRITPGTLSQSEMIMQDLANSGGLYNLGGGNKVKLNSGGKLELLNPSVKSSVKETPTLPGTQSETKVILNEILKEGNVPKNQLIVNSIVENTAKAFGQDSSAALKSQKEYLDKFNQLDPAIQEAIYAEALKELHRYTMDTEVKTGIWD